VLADSISLKLLVFYCIWSEAKLVPDLCSFHVIGRDLCWWTATLAMHKGTEALTDTTIQENLCVLAVPMKFSEQIWTVGFKLSNSSVLSTQRYVVVKKRCEIRKINITRIVPSTFCVHKISNCCCPWKFLYCLVRAELTIGQTGQMPGASRLNIKTLLLFFHVYRLFTTRQNCRACWLLR